MVKIGIAGIGFMGMIHYLAAQRVSGAKVTAIAARDPRKRAGDWTMIQGNFGPRGSRMDLGGVETFETAEDMIRRADVDLVDICLPSDDHASAVLAALDAGKHVLVEKPIALTLEEADRMVARAQTRQRLLMVAHVLPFFADFRFAHESISSGRYGRVLAAHFRRHISPPSWSDSVADLAKMGGPLIDLHIHDTHFIALALGRPRQIFSNGICDNGVVRYVSTEYLYEGGPVVSATSGCLSQQTRPFTHGYEIYFENATLHYEAGNPVTIHTAAGAEHPALAAADEIDAFRQEIEAAVQSIARGQSDPTLDGALARDALSLCLKEGESIRAGRPVAFS